MTQHLTARNSAMIEKAATELAKRHGLEQADVHSRILNYVAPYPPREQCREAIERVRREIEETLKPPEQSGQDA